MLIATVVIIAKTLKQSKCPSTGEWMNKMWPLLTIELYSATKRKNLLKHVTTWMNLRNIPQRKRSQKPKDYVSCDFIYMNCPHQCKFLETGSRSVVVMG